MRWNLMTFEDICIKQNKMDTVLQEKGPALIILAQSISTDSWTAGFTGSVSQGNVDIKLTSKGSHENLKNIKQSKTF